MLVTGAVNHVMLQLVSGVNVTVSVQVNSPEEDHNDQDAWKVSANHFTLWSHDVCLCEQFNLLKF